VGRTTIVGQRLRHHGAVNLTDAEPIDVRPLLLGEREDLLNLLISLETNDWGRPSAVPGWNVKDLALHLLDGELGVLSRNRDGDSSCLIDAVTHEALVEGLAAKNQRWIDGSQHLSPGVIADLLTWSGRQVNAYYSTVEHGALGDVSWASSEPVPVWLDIAREFTERWVHQMQIREALGVVDDYANKYLPTVLRVFVWAFPHQYRATAESGTEVNIDLESGGEWSLRCDGGGVWTLEAQAARAPAVSARLGDDVAWRLLTGATYDREALDVTGPERYVEPLLGVRAVIV
jgi:uncharacterized protein (TIGR03083 family)